MANDYRPSSRQIDADTVDSDTVDCVVCNYFYCGVPGALKYNDANGNPHTIDNVTQGYHPIQVSRVFTTGTDAALVADMFLHYT